VPATLAPLAPVTLEGRYLTLEPVAERHARDLFDVMQDEDVCRYLAWPPPQALDETLALIRQAEDLMARRESIVFAQIWKATGRPSSTMSTASAYPMTALCTFATGRTRGFRYSLWRASS